MQFTPSISITPRHQILPSPIESELQISRSINLETEEEEKPQEREKKKKVKIRRSRKRSKPTPDVDKEMRISKNSQTSFIVSVITNKANNVGISAINLRSNKIYLTQHAETSFSCPYTLSLIREYNPREIVYPLNLKDSQIVSVIEEELPNTKATYIARKYFNENKGYSLLKNLCMEESSIETNVTKKYLCVSSFHALIEYVQNSEHTSFANGSFDIRYKPADCHLLLDAKSIRNLELIENLKTGGTIGSLFGLLNYTQTAMGKRLLRTNLLQPLTSKATIDSRHEAITELLSSENLYSTVNNLLRNFVDLDYLLSKFTSNSLTKNYSSKRGEQLLQWIIELKQCVEIIPSIVSEIEKAGGCKSSVLKAILDIFEQPGIKEIHSEIVDIIDTEIKFTKNTLTMQVAKVFAIHQGKSGLLDVARRVYSDAIQEIHSLKVSTEEETSESLELKHSISKGYYFNIVAESFENLGETTKKQFNKISKRGKKILVTTRELVNLNRRIQTTLQEIFIQSEKVLGELVEKIKKKIYLLSKVSEGIALLDLIFSFATLVILNKDYVMPNITESGSLALKDCRHPILESNAIGQKCVANTTYMYEDNNLHIITGPNSAGKSTYLKQLGLCVIMVHLGSFVPASFCSMRLFDKLLTKLSINEEIESNTSSFLMEMKEISNILSNVSNDSCVLIDELGRGTSNIEGVGIAWAVCEFLLNLKAYTIFVTHYLQLVELEAIYPNSKNFHFEVVSTDKSLQYVYKLVEGSTAEDKYGLKLANMLGFPTNCLKNAFELHNKVQNLQKNEKKSSHEIEEMTKIKKKFSIGGKIFSLKDSTLDIKGMAHYLRIVKKEIHEFEENNKVDENKMDTSEEENLFFQK